VRTEVHGFDSVERHCLLGPMGYDDCMKIDEMNVYPFCL